MHWDRSKNEQVREICNMLSLQHLGVVQEAVRNRVLEWVQQVCPLGWKRTHRYNTTTAEAMTVLKVCWEEWGRENRGRRSTFKRLRGGPGRRQKTRREWCQLVLHLLMEEIISTRNSCSVRAGKVSPIRHGAVGYNAKCSVKFEFQIKMNFFRISMSLIFVC